MVKAVELLNLSIVMRFNMPVDVSQNMLPELLRFSLMADEEEAAGAAEAAEAAEDRHRSVWILLTSLDRCKANHRRLSRVR